MRGAPGKHGWTWVVGWVLLLALARTASAEEWSEADSKGLAIIEVRWPEPDPLGVGKEPGVVTIANTGDLPLKNVRVQVVAKPTVRVDFDPPTIERLAPREVRHIEFTGPFYSVQTALVAVADGKGWARASLAFHEIGAKAKPEPHPAYRLTAVAPQRVLVGRPFDVSFHVLRNHHVLNTWFPVAAAWLSITVPDGLRIVRGEASAELALESGTTLADLQSGAPPLRLVAERAGTFRIRGIVREKSGTATAGVLLDVHVPAQGLPPDASRRAGAETARERPAEIRLRGSRDGSVEAMFSAYADAGTSTAMGRFVDGGDAEYVAALRDIAGEVTRARGEAVPTRLVLDAQPGARWAKSHELLSHALHAGLWIHEIVFVDPSGGPAVTFARHRLTTQEALRETMLFVHVGTSSAGKSSNLGGQILLRGKIHDYFTFPRVWQGRSRETPTRILESLGGSVRRGMRAQADTWSEGAVWLSLGGAPAHDDLYDILAVFRDAGVDTLRIHDRYLAAPPPVRRPRDTPGGSGVVGLGGGADGFMLRRYPWRDEVDASERDAVEEDLRMLYEGGRDGEDARERLLRRGARIASRIVSEFKVIADDVGFDELDGKSRVIAIDRLLRRNFGDAVPHKPIWLSSSKADIRRVARAWGEWLGSLAAGDERDPGRRDASTRPSDPTLPESVATEEDPRVRRRVDRLILELRDGIPDVASKAAHSLGEEGSRRAVPTLLNALRGYDDQFVRIAAVIALGKLMAVDAVPGLIEAIGDVDNLVANSAESSLNTITGRDVPPIAAYLAPRERKRVQAAWRKWFEENEAALRRRLGQ